MLSMHKGATIVYDALLGECVAISPFGSGRFAMIARSRANRTSANYVLAASSVSGWVRDR
jgi:hypothetical protein